MSMDSKSIGFWVDHFTTTLESFQDAFERSARTQEQKQLASEFKQFADETIDIVLGREPLDANEARNESFVALLDQYTTKAQGNRARAMLQSSIDRTEISGVNRILNGRNEHER
jgi:hypothetical protein